MLHPIIWYWLATFELDTRTLVEKSIDLEYIFTRASIVKKDAASILTS